MKSKTQIEHFIKCLIIGVKKASTHFNLTLEISPYKLVT